MPGPQALEELGRGQLEAVPVGPLVHDQLGWYKLDVILQHQLIRQIAGGVAHERDRATCLQRLVLGAHVVRLGGLEGSQPLAS